MKSELGGTDVSTKLRASFINNCEANYVATHQGKGDLMGDTQDITSRLKYSFETPPVHTIPVHSLQTRRRNSRHFSATSVQQWSSEIQKSYFPVRRNKRSFTTPHKIVFPRPVGAVDASPIYNNAFSISSSGIQATDPVGTCRASEQYRTAATEMEDVSLAPPSFFTNDQTTPETNSQLLLQQPCLPLLCSLGSSELVHPTTMYALLTPTARGATERTPESTSFFSSPCKAQVPLTLPDQQLDPSTTLAIPHFNTCTEQRQQRSRKKTATFTSLSVSGTPIIGLNYGDLVEPVHGTSAHRTKETDYQEVASFRIASCSSRRQDAEKIRSHCLATPHHGGASLHGTREVETRNEKITSDNTSLYSLSDSCGLVSNTSPQETPLSPLCSPVISSGEKCRHTASVVPHSRSHPALLSIKDDDNSSAAEQCHFPFTARSHRSYTAVGEGWTTRGDDTFSSADERLKAFLHVFPTIPPCSATDRLEIPLSPSRSCNGSNYTYPWSRPSEATRTQPVTSSEKRYFDEQPNRLRKSSSSASLRRAAPVDDRVSLLLPFSVDAASVSVDTERQLTPHLNFDGIDANNDRPLDLSSRAYRCKAKLPVPSWNMGLLPQEQPGIPEHFRKSGPSLFGQALQPIFPSPRLAFHSPSSGTFLNKRQEESGLDAGETLKQLLDCLAEMSYDEDAGSPSAAGAAATVLRDAHQLVLTRDNAYSNCDPLYRTSPDHCRLTDGNPYLLAQGTVHRTPGMDSVEVDTSLPDSGLTHRSARDWVATCESTAWQQTTTGHAVGSKPVRQNSQRSARLSPSLSPVSLSSFSSVAPASYLYNSSSPAHSQMPSPYVDTRACRLDEYGAATAPASMIHDASLMLANLLHNSLHNSSNLQSVTPSEQDTLKDDPPSPIEHCSHDIPGYRVYISHATPAAPLIPLTSEHRRTSTSDYQKLEKGKRSLSALATTAQSHLSIPFHHYSVPFYSHSLSSGAADCGGTPSNVGSHASDPRLKPREMAQRVYNTNWKRTDDASEQRSNRNTHCYNSPKHGRSTSVQRSQAASHSRTLTRLTLPTTAYRNCQHRDQCSSSLGDSLTPLSGSCKGPLLLSPPAVEAGVATYGGTQSGINNHYSKDPRAHGALTPIMSTSGLKLRKKVNASWDSAAQPLLKSTSEYGTALFRSISIHDGVFRDVRRNTQLNFPLRTSPATSTTTATDLNHDEPPSLLLVQDTNSDVLSPEITRECRNANFQNASGQLAPDPDSLNITTGHDTATQLQEHAGSLGKDPYATTSTIEASEKPETTTPGASISKRCLPLQHMTLNRDPSLYEPEASSKDFDGSCSRKHFRIVPYAGQDNSNSAVLASVSSRIYNECDTEGKDTNTLRELYPNNVSFRDEEDGLVCETTRNIGAVNDVAAVDGGTSNEAIALSSPQNESMVSAKVYTDDRDRMVYVSWIPKKARAFSAVEKRKMELTLKRKLREDLGLTGLTKVLLFPPRGVHCKLIFDCRTSALTFMGSYGGDNGSEKTERWKAELCRIYHITMHEKFDNTIVKIEWSQK